MSNYFFLCLLIQIVPYFSVKIIENASEQRRKRSENEKIKIAKFLVWFFVCAMVESCFKYLAVNYKSINHSNRNPSRDHFIHLSINQSIDHCSRYHSRDHFINLSINQSIIDQSTNHRHIEISVEINFFTYQSIINQSIMAIEITAEITLFTYQSTN